MKKLQLLLLTLLASSMTGTFASHAIAADQSLEGGNATIDCIPGQGVALWTLDRLDDPIVYIDHTVNFSSGRNFNRGYFVVPSFTLNGAEASENSTETWAGFAASGFGTYLGFNVPFFRTSCQ